MEKRVYVLAHDQARRNAADFCMEAPADWRVEFKPRTRSSDQNALLHSIFGEVARQSEWHGRKLTPTQWKTLFISGHAVATGLGADVLPGLEGEFCNVRESSAQMSVGRMTSLLEYVIAFCTERGIHIKVPA